EAAEDGRRPHAGTTPRIIGMAGAGSYARKVLIRSAAPNRKASTRHDSGELPHLPIYNDRGSMNRLGAIDAAGGATAIDDPFAGIRGRRIEIPIREDLEMSTAWIAVDTFEELGFEARLVTDATADVSSDRIVFLGGNALWHERALDRVRALPRPERPVVVVWHSEPLPLPRPSGLRPARLTARELAKILL